LNTKYDLKDRTFNFSLGIVKFCTLVSKNPEVKELSRQLLRSGTSVGANVEEADGSRTRKEFANKMTIARNEAREAAFWLRLILGSELLHNKLNIDKAKYLLLESEELRKILSSIIGKIN
jgi:four helix bundle protein